ncbi:MAG: Ig-like domain-containing protein, partial [Lachnospiraceae bacterium]|nr:Ig-like domain-containing protein [Lachnospiraceae bacterium]
MKHWKRTKQRLLAGLLCAVLVVTNTNLTSVQVLANEPETEVVKEDLYEDEGTTSSVDMTETDASEEKVDMEDTQWDKAEPSETESVSEDEETTTTVTDEEEEACASEIENEAASQSELKLVEKGEMTGVYQFGGAPSKKKKTSSAYSVHLAGVDNTAELQEYVYQQMVARNTNIDMTEFNIAWDNKTDVSSIVWAVINEHPELYFVNSSFGYVGAYVGSDIVIGSIEITYDNDLDNDAFQKASKEALAVVKTGMSDLEKAIALHDYLAVNCEYDKENLDANKIPATSYTAYGTLVNRMAVCQGYALTYKYLLNQVGIDCYMVTSDTMNHAWNLIKLNGNYYQVDVTWDDPTWDLIGRACHQNMFRSDDAFVNECEHHDWSVTKGSDVVDYKATDTSYDNAFWVDCDAPLVLVGKDCYYVTYDSEKKTGVINKTTLADLTGTGESICDIGKWPVWDGSGNWQGAYSGLFQTDNRLYYNDKSSIYSIALESTESDMDKRTEFTADTTNGYIYGSAFCQGNVLYSLHQTPNLKSKETVLKADITIEIAVEEIALDKRTVTLPEGETVELTATVTPSYATDATVTWESSNDSVATVEDGMVTAVSEGICIITASAGTEIVTCTVTVTAKN